MSMGQDFEEEYQNMRMALKRRVYVYLDIMTIITLPDYIMESTEMCQQLTNINVNKDILTLKDEQINKFKSCINKFNNLMNKFDTKEKINYI
jgi:hypothetical protein